MATFAICPIPEFARLGRTLNKWRREFLAYFDTAAPPTAASKPPTAHRASPRIARGFRNRNRNRDNYDSGCS